MRVRETIFKLGTFDNFKRDIKEHMHEEPNRDRNTIYLQNTALLSKILSPRRIELLRAIKEYPEYGVSELAKQLKRKQEAVSRDITYLRTHGIIETEYEDRKVIATAVPGRVVIEI